MDEKELTPINVRVQTKLRFDELKAIHARRTGKAITHDGYVNCLLELYQSWTIGEVPKQEGAINNGATNPEPTNNDR